MIADNLTAMTPYDVTVASTAGWNITLREPLQWFTLQALLRPPITPGAPAIITNANFDGCGAWSVRPTLESHHTAAGRAIERLNELKACATFDDVNALLNGLSALVLADSAPDAVRNVAVATARVHKVLPDSRVDLLMKSRWCMTLPTMIRSLARMHVVSIDEIRDALRSSNDRGGVGYPDFRARPYFQLLTTLELRKSTGFVLNDLEWDLIIDYGKAIALVGNDVRVERLRGEAREHILVAREEFRRTYREIASDGSERAWVRLWLADRLAALFSTLAYLGSYADRATLVINPVRQWADIATVSDISALATRLIVADDATQVVLLSFDILDRFVQLTGHPVERLLGRNFLKKAAACIDPQLSTIHAGIHELLVDANSTLVDSLWNGLLSEDVRNAQSITLTDRSGAQINKSKEEFAYGLLGALRNTTHGYDLTGYRFDQYLVRHSGLVPDEVRDIAIGLVFALVASPSTFLARRVRIDAIVRVGVP